MKTRMLAYSLAVAAALAAAVIVAIAHNKNRLDKVMDTLTRTEVSHVAG